jgi:hypothetical protein
MLPQPTSEFYSKQQRLIVATLALTRSAWGRMDLANLDGSWARVAPVLTQILTSAQFGAARNGARYVGPTLEDQGQFVKPAALVRVNGFVGFASDGRSLASRLDGAKVTAKTAQSLDVAGKWLDMAVHTQVADAARQSASVDMFTRPGVGYVRAVNPPCCQRCAVLAGRFYKVSAFQRHPRCDCFQVPTTVAKPNGFGQSIEPDQIKDLTTAQRAAIADGADQNRVINSHRAGKRGKDGMTTTELAKRGKARLTPEAIYRVSATRDEALRLLKTHGYVL